MDTNLQNLITATSSSIQEAQKELEYNSVNLYYKEFEKQTQDNESGTSEVLVPIMQKIGIPAANGEMAVIDVPVTSLLKHNSMVLEQVTIKMNVSLAMDNNTITAKVCGNNANDENEHRTPSEIELVIKRKDPSEGIAKQNQEFLKFI